MNRTGATQIQVEICARDVLEPGYDRDERRQRQGSGARRSGHPRKHWPKGRSWSHGRQSDRHDSSKLDTGDHSASSGAAPRPRRRAAIRSATRPPASHYYHPDMKGSWSIKAVLPTVARELVYEGGRRGRSAGPLPNSFRVHQTLAVLERSRRRCEPVAGGTPSRFGRWHTDSPAIEGERRLRSAGRSEPRGFSFPGAALGQALSTAPARGAARVGRINSSFGSRPALDRACRAGAAFDLRAGGAHCLTECGTRVADTP
jgi:hypothetical protein